ncbi:glycoside hydrolase family 76 protein [Arthrobacter burdickii]|uniref:Glycoside hydrolase family 76 protein n=1 Tax=Arthrobacter burdickii TaxID=3035920 RepID=A0ABT8JVW8_9MICC|nr:glycoside hydrolase family 76 protein [Arthrobacter burdickii]MDN4609320.1 glycoside hydrolase family 76 protein [Arthrobacter burdickii]
MPIPDEAAASAAHSVRHLFSRRSLHVPGTRLGAIALPAPIGRRHHWHYWWQAHFLDCLLDEHLRDPAGNALSEARKLARGIWLRNGGRWLNSYYDDMAWLALTLQRLDAMEGRRRPRRRVRVLGDALRSAHTDELGGGIFWNTTRDYKNTATTAPAALFFARAGDFGRAQELLDWLRTRVHDPATGLYLDGVKADGSAGGVVDRRVYTYNQGTVLGALVAVGGRENLEHAADLVDAVSRSTADDDGALPLGSSGDGGLFAGILGRYLALAVSTPGIGARAAATGRSLLATTAERLWTGRMQAGPGVFLFPPRQEGPVSLSSQLQAWTMLEAEQACR